MPPILDYIGLFNIFFFATSTLYLINRSRIDLKKNTLCWLGSHAKYGKIFNLTLFIFASLQVVFVLNASYKITGKLISYTNALFVAGGISLFLAGIFTKTKNPLLHIITTSTCSLLISTGIIFLAIKIFPNHPGIGIALFISTLLIPTAYSLQKKLTGAYWEVILSIGVALWNILLTLLLIK